MCDNMMVWTDHNENVAPDKKNSSEKIVAAAVMALSRALAGEAEGGSVYDEKGIITVSRRLGKMAEGQKNTGDLFGLAPFGDALNTTLKGVGEFLGRICLPAAEETGLALRDKVSAWRANNLVKIAQKAESLVAEREKQGPLHAHPRLVRIVINEGSWADDDQVQSMWAGLLASSCTPDGKDEGNLLFINILSQITSSQVKIINYGCENCEKEVTDPGWLIGEPLTLHLKDLEKMTEIKDIHRLDRELDHLRNLGLIGGIITAGGFGPYSKDADITPSSLSLQMYVRCHGHVGSPVEFFGLNDK